MENALLLQIVPLYAYAALSPSNFFLLLFRSSSTGYYSGDAALSCISCLAGYVTTTSGLSTCTPCSSGYYCGSGASTCLACPSGLYAAGTANTACTSCDKGTYSAAAASGCTDCSAGRVSSHYGTLFLCVNMAI